MTGEPRMPTWKERENNKRRERRRRAIAGKIFTGLRLHGNYSLPKHCDNNEVLKALCHEAGWTVETDGTTYRRGSKPVGVMAIMGGSVSSSPCPSHQPRPFSSPYAAPIAADANSLIPWVRNLSSSSTSSASSSNYFDHYMHGGSISAPVTPPFSCSPNAQTPQTDCSGCIRRYPFLPLSMPPSPGHYVGNHQVPQTGSTSSTFSHVSSNPFGFRVEEFRGRGSSVMCTPGQSGTCSPVVATGDIPMSEVIPQEFAFGRSAAGFVKPWEGERIHEECGLDDLELTLGSSKNRQNSATFCQLSEHTLKA